MVKKWFTRKNLVKICWKALTWTEIWAEVTPTPFHLQLLVGLAELLGRHYLLHFLMVCLESFECYLQVIYNFIASDMSVLHFMEGKFVKA